METLATQYSDRQAYHSLVVDLSAGGVRIERPYYGGPPAPSAIQIELELPGIDEVIWARGDVCFDRVVRGLTGSRLIQRTGVELVAAGRDLRLLREYVFEVVPARTEDWLPHGAEEIFALTL